MARRDIESEVQQSADVKRPRLAVLDAVRLAAALHIYFFHLMQAHFAGLLTFESIDALPSFVTRFLARGFVSTGLFFQLSGLLLAYTYLGRDGRPKTDDTRFWKGRFVRLYPLYFVSLVLLIPAPALLPITAKPASAIETVGMVATNLTLIQAWFPQFAIAWNAPAWALSAFAAFYLIFPAFARSISGWHRRALLGLLGVMLAASWAPAVAYFAIDPAGDAWTATSITLGGFWLNVLRFDPLVWMPQFLSGVVLGRLVNLEVDGGQGRDEELAHPRWAVGDLVAVSLVLILAFGDGIPYVALRHGLAAPLTLIVLADIARGRGILPRLFRWNGLSRLADASFGVFALQMPVGLYFAVATLKSSHGSVYHLMGIIATTLTVSILWTEFVQRPYLRRSRPASIATAIRGPRFALAKRFRDRTESVGARSK
jgi:peptidoglycan/LPS O-acetylase OafA/YrhL